MFPVPSSQQSNFPSGLIHHPFQLRSTHAPLYIACPAMPVMPCSQSRYNIRATDAKELNNIWNLRHQFRPRFTLSHGEKISRSFH